MENSLTKLKKKLNKDLSFLREATPKQQLCHCRVAGAARLLDRDTGASLFGPELASLQHGAKAVSFHLENGLSIQNFPHIKTNW